MKNVYGNAHLLKLPNEIFDQIIFFTLYGLELHELVLLQRVCRRFEVHVTSVFLRFSQCLHHAIRDAESKDQYTYAPITGSRVTKLSAHLIRYEWNNPGLMPHRFRSIVEAIEVRTLESASSLAACLNIDNVRAVTSEILALTSDWDFWSPLCYRLEGFSKFARERTALLLGELGIYEISIADSREGLTEGQTARIKNDVLALAVAAANEKLVSHLLRKQEFKMQPGVIFPSPLYTACMMGNPELLSVLLQTICTNYTHRNTFWKPPGSGGNVFLSDIESFASSAAICGHSQTHEFLLRHAEGLLAFNLTESYEMGRLGLLEAAKSSCLPILKTLVPRLSTMVVTFGDDPYRRAYYDNPPIFRETHRRIILTKALTVATVSCASVQVIRYLVDQGADLKGEFFAPGEREDFPDPRGREVAGRGCPAMRQALLRKYPKTVRELAIYDGNITNPLLAGWIYNRHELGPIQALFDLFPINDRWEDSRHGKEIIECIMRIFLYATEDARIHGDFLIAQYLVDRFGNYEWFWTTAVLRNLAEIGIDVATNPNVMMNWCETFVDVCLKLQLGTNSEAVLLVVRSKLFDICRHTGAEGGISSELEYSILG